MVDGRGGACFIQKCVHLYGGGIFSGGQNLDGDFPVQCDIQRPVDRCHAADAAGFLQQIAVKPLRDNQFCAADRTGDMTERLEFGYIQFLLALMTEDSDGARVRSGRRVPGGKFFRERLRRGGTCISVDVRLLFSHDSLP